MPERAKTPHPKPDQILVRIDSVGICYSDVKLLNQGNHHPKILGRDLSINPTRLGHEVCFTVGEVGNDLEDEFSVGQRYTVQPEVMHNAVKQTYGFSIPGGLTQYQLIGPELLETDQGTSLLQIPPGIGYSEAAILEPLGSVLATYTQNRRLFPKKGGRMWILGNPQSSLVPAFTQYLDLPDFILCSNLPRGLEETIRAEVNQVKKLDLDDTAQYLEITKQETEGFGFDDIVILDPQSTKQLETVIDLVNPGGLINIVGTKPLNGKIYLDPQRIHYQFIAIVGNDRNDISASYGSSRNRSGFNKEGTAFIFGGGGPIGQMHLQYLLSQSEGPNIVLVSEINPARLDFLETKYSVLAQKMDKELYIINPLDYEDELRDVVKGLIGKPVIDDIVVLVPEVEVMEQASVLIHNNSLINLFAGTPAGLKIPIDPSMFYLGNLQITGASGLEYQHIQLAQHQTAEGIIDLNAMVVAVGGMGAARDGIQAAGERQFPGKIIIYPQLEDLPLLGIPELIEKFPSIKSTLTKNGFWTKEAETALFKMVS
jgi:threonine dehydrogenase-like Zn-dependent dehydrogenase